MLRSLIFPGLFDTLYESCHWLAVYRINYLIISHLPSSHSSPFSSSTHPICSDMSRGEIILRLHLLPSSQPDRTKKNPPQKEKKRTCKGFLHVFQVIRVIINSLNLTTVFFPPSVCKRSSYIIRCNVPSDPVLYFRERKHFTYHCNPLLILGSTTLYHPTLRITPPQPGHPISSHHDLDRYYSTPGRSDSFLISAMWAVVTSPEYPESTRPPHLLRTLNLPLSMPVTQILP